MSTNRDNSHGQLQRYVMQNINFLSITQMLLLVAVHIAPTNNVFRRLEEICGHSNLDIIYGIVIINQLFVIY